MLYDLLLNADWSDLYTIQEVNEACAYFYSILYGILDVCVPRSSIHKRTYPVWFTSEIIKIIKRKHKILKKLKKIRIPHIAESI